MRCADTPGRAGRVALLALALLLGGCAALDRVLGNDANTFRDADQKAAADPAKAAGAGAASAGSQGAGAPAAANAVPAAPVPPPVDPAVVQAFEAAVAALQAGKTEAAQRGFAQLAAAHPELGGPHANLGILYRHAGKLDEAVAELEKAVQANAQQPVYWNQLGIAYRQQGRFDKARAAYEQAIKVDPGYAPAKLNLGVLFDLYLWDGTHALEQYQQYLALTPGGDAKVSKWVADLRNRAGGPGAKGAKEAP
jgi:Flp pilus assembly protein TadD